MKNLHIVLTVFAFMFFSVQNTYAQAKNSKVQEKVYKTTTADVPQQVKETLKKYSGYEISKAATFTKKRKTTVYRFKVKDGNWSYDLLIDEKGKVKGIDTGEHSSR